MKDDYADTVTNVHFYLHTYYIIAKYSPQ